MIRLRGEVITRVGNVIGIKLPGGRVVRVPAGDIPVGATVEIEVKRNGVEVVRVVKLPPTPMEATHDEPQAPITYHGGNQEAVTLDDEEVFNTTEVGGDLYGEIVSPTVVGIQGHPVSSISPSQNQVLSWNGTEWAPHTLTPEEIGADPYGAATSERAAHEAAYDHTLIPTAEQRAALDAANSPSASNPVSTAADTQAVQSALDSHTSRTDNPHQVTADQIGALLASEAVPLYPGDEADIISRVYGIQKLQEMIDGFDYPSPIPSSWQWATDAPFSVLTEAPDYASHGWTLGVPSILRFILSSGTGSFFLYRSGTPAGTIQVVAAFATTRNDTEIGIRVDDGSSNNYVELCAKATEPVGYTFVFRKCIAGAITESIGESITLPLPFGLKISISGTKWSNWNAVPWYMIPYNLTLMAQARAVMSSASGLGWTPQRYGIVAHANHSAGLCHIGIDAFFDLGL